MLRALFSAVGKALHALAYGALWLLLLPVRMLAPRGQSAVPAAPARPARAAKAASSATAPAPAANLDARPSPDLELQAAAAVSLLYRRAQGWSWRDQLSTGEFSPAVEAWLLRLSGDEALAAVKAGKTALFAHLSGKDSIEGVPSLYGRRRASAARAAVDGNRRRPAAADGANEPAEPDAPYLSAARI